MKLSTTNTAEVVGHNSSRNRVKKALWEGARGCGGMLREAVFMHSPLAQHVNGQILLIEKKGFLLISWWLRGFIYIYIYILVYEVGHDYLCRQTDLVCLY